MRPSELDLLGEVGDLGEAAFWGDTGGCTAIKLFKNKHKIDCCRTLTCQLEPIRNETYPAFIFAVYLTYDNIHILHIVPAPALCDQKEEEQEKWVFFVILKVGTTYSSWEEEVSCRRRHGRRRAIGRRRRALQYPVILCFLQETQYLQEGCDIHADPIYS